MKISTIIKSNLALTKEQGEKLKSRIEKKLYEGKRITLDFSGITCLSVHFIMPVSDLLSIYSPDTLEDKVRFINISNFNLILIRQCIKNKIKINESKNLINNNQK